MAMHRWSLLTAVALFLAGCGATGQQHNVQDVHICVADDCDTSGRKYSTAQLFAGFLKLLKANEGAKVTICDSNPRTRTCEHVGVCQFVLGGILPGPGCSQSMVFSEITTGKQADRINMKVNMPLTFIGTPVFCKTTDATFSVHSPEQISLEFQPRFCNWMVMGNMSATFNLAVNSLDLHRGQIGGYWSHAVTGTGNGRGSGYMVLKFPQAMPDGENWLVGRPVGPLSETATVAQ